MRQEITNINLTLTTFCSMKCPDCCCNITAMKNSDKRFFSFEYFENAAKYFYGIERIHLTGGEPTMHPDFVKFAQSFKELFGCKRLTIETNGFFIKHREHEIYVLAHYFDEVYFSHYKKDMYPGCEDNLYLINKLRMYKEMDNFVCNGNGAKLCDIIVGEIDHISREKRGTKMCHRGYSETLGYSNGKLYPCCVASGIPENDVGILLTENWREEILNIHAPCEICFFAE